MRPLNGFVLVRPLEDALETASGLFLPEARTTQTRVQYGDVLETSYPEVQVGDRVYFSRAVGGVIKADDRDILTIHGKDILGILLPGEPHA